MPDFDETSPLGLSFSDLPPLEDFDASLSSLPDELGSEEKGRLLHCEAGDHEFRHVGRGRAPKSCPEHRSRTSVRAGANTVRGKKHETRLADLENDLLSELVKIGKGVSAAMPVTGIVLVDRSERTAKALVRVAGKNEKVLAALEVAAKAAPAFDLTETILMVGVALMVDTKRMNPDTFLPVVSGVSEYWHQVNDEVPSSVSVPLQRRTQEPADFIGMPPQSVPTRFETITP